LLGRFTAPAVAKLIASANVSKQPNSVAGWFEPIGSRRSTQCSALIFYADAGTTIIKTWTKHISNIRLNLSMIEFPFFHKSDLQEVKSVSCRSCNNLHALSIKLLPSNLFYIYVYAYTNKYNLKQIPSKINYVI
jgi:hypothetical protein